jgi:hypothetical protein
MIKEHLICLYAVMYGVIKRILYGCRPFRD